LILEDEEFIRLDKAATIVAASKLITDFDYI